MNKLDSLDSLLMSLLEDGKYYTLEQLSEDLEYPKDDIHRSFVRLCKNDGWSIRPENDTPYWRDDRNYSYGSDGRERIVRPMPRVNRGREKGETYDHDHAEPDWERTSYKVRRP